jgi:hypothetical protein
MIENGNLSLLSQMWLKVYTTRQRGKNKTNPMGFVLIVLKIGKQGSLCVVRIKISNSETPELGVRRRTRFH